MFLFRKFKSILAKINGRFLKRAEKRLLEHIPEKHQRSVLSVYRSGFWLNIAGIYWTIMGIVLILFAIVPGKDGSTHLNILLPAIVFTATVFGVACLGGWVTHLKIRPSQMFGLALTFFLINLIIVGFAGMILIGANIAKLEQIYGTIQMAIINGILSVVILFPAVLLLEHGYYLFRAHKDFVAWYEERNKKTVKKVKNTNKTTQKPTKKTAKPKSDDDLGDDLL